MTSVAPLPLDIGRPGQQLLPGIFILKDSFVLIHYSYSN